MTNKNPFASATNPRSVIQAAAIETLENRQLMAATYAVGIGVNDGSSSFMNATSGKLKSLGVQTVRLYLSANFNSNSWNGVMQRAIDYSNLGFDVTLTVVPSNGTVYSTSAVTSWFKWAVSNSSLKNAVDRWEIGNEPDHSEYWKGSLSSYVTNLLKPAYQVLHAAGETVASAGPSWDPADVQTMIDAGMLSYTDYVGFHPYASGVSGVLSSLAEIKSVVAGRKPLIATEWNVRGLEGNASAWAAADQQVYTAIASTFAINYYYAAEKVNTMAGPAGIMTSSGAANQPFYNMFATFKSQASSISAGSGSTSSSSSSSSSGSTAAAGTGSISGTVFNDDNANGVFDSSENASGARTVFIDSNGNGKLDTGEKSITSASNGTFKFTGLSAGTYKLSRVMPSGYHLSNFQNDVTVTVNAGQSVTGANIGSTTLSAPKTTTSSSGSSSTTTTSGTGKITGSLWNDTDGDGVWDSNEVASGVRTVFIDTNGDGELDNGEVYTTSASNGTYSFSNLAAGTFNISRVFPSGYALSNSKTDDIVVTVAAGQTVSGVNLGTHEV